MERNAVVEVAWIGLGAMGWPMAGHVAGSFPTRVWNRTLSVAEAHIVDHGTRACELDQCAEADVVLTCLPTTAEVGEVARRLGPSLREGAVWVDCTSGEPEGSRAIAEELAEHGVTYLDAPVSGGTDGAEAGTLTVMVGGDEVTLARVKPVIETFAARVVHVGPTGAGHAVKAVNNTLLAANLWAASEGLAALVKQGVPAATALEVINGSSGRSNATENLIPQRVVTREFPATFTLGLLAKDVGIGQRVIDGSALPAPLLRQVAELMAIALQDQGSDVDHTALARVVEGWAGAEIR